MKNIFTLALCAVMAITASAQHQWLHIYQSNGKISTGVTSEVQNIDFSKQNATDTVYEKMNVTRNGVNTTFRLQDVDSVVVGDNIPTIYIDIENGAEVVVKDTYLNAKIRIDGYGIFDDFDEADVTIKGRGNSTWNMEKKPYRLKFSKKQSLLGFAKSKNYALIANMIDCTMLRNPIALKLAQMLGLEYTNHFVPVNLVINGTYRGAYMVTEKIGINSSSVDLDETKSVLFELDTNYDENYRFHSSVFRLPVMVKDPDFDELAAMPDATMTAQQMFEKWKNEFQTLENTLSTYGNPSSQFTELMDISTLVDYLIVYNVAGNYEPHHPKSVYLYKTEGAKFKFGPVWDFDWAYTFDDAEGRGKYDQKLFFDNSCGSSFFKAMCREPKVMALYKERWNYFKSELYPQLLEFIDSYAKTIEVSAAQNGEKWPAGYYSGKYSLGGTENFATNLQTLKKWIANRINYIETSSNYGLY